MFRIAVVKLGKREIDALICPPGRQDMLVGDDELTGFTIRVSSSGTKTFLFQYRFGGRVRRLRLGLYGDLTPPQARKLAETARGEVAAGRDPVGERKARHAVFAAENKASALTLSILLQQWRDEALRDRSARYAAEATRCLTRALSAFLEEPANRLDGDRIQSTLDGIARAHPTTARRVRAYGRAMYGWAVRRRLVGANPFLDAVADGREAGRERVLTDVEIGEAWRAAAALGPPFGPFFCLLMLTLQRRNEVAGLRRDELSPDLSIWTIPGTRTKNRRPHVVHLTPAARATLFAMPPVLVAGKASSLVFTTNGKRAISGFQNAREQLNKLIRDERRRRQPRTTRSKNDPDGSSPLDWRLHDMRRTAVTVLARLGVLPDVADRMLNHLTGSRSGVKAIYQRYEFLAEREAASNIWAEHVLRVAADEPAKFAAIEELRSITKS